MGALGAVIVGVAAAREPSRSSPSRPRAGDGHAVRAGVGLHPGLPEGPVRCPRGRHHDHAQLRRPRGARGGGQRAAQRRRARRRRSRPTSATPRSRSSSAGTAISGSSMRRSWPCSTAGCCSGRPAASRSASPAPARTRRATPACRRSGLIIWTMSVAGLLAGMAGATDLLGTTHQMTVVIRHDGRLRRDRGGAARPDEPDRHRACRAAVRRDADRGVGRCRSRPASRPSSSASSRPRSCSSSSPARSSRACSGSAARRPAWTRRRPSRATYGGEATIR